MTVATTGGLAIDVGGSGGMTTAVYDADLDSYVDALDSDGVGDGLTGGSGTDVAVEASGVGGANISTSILVTADGVAIAVDDVTLEDNGADQLRIKGKGVGTAQIDDGAVETLQLATQSVTNAVLAQMAANTIKVNATAGAAVPTDLALAAGTAPARLASGNIVAATAAQLAALLGALVYSAIVGAGRTYTTVTAAFAAAKYRVSLAPGETIVETADPTLVNGTNHYVYIPQGSFWDCETNTVRIDGGDASAFLTIQGESRFTSKVAWATAGNVTFIGDTDSVGGVVADELLIDNNSGASNTYFAGSGVKQNISGCRVTLPNMANTGFTMSTASSSLSDVYFEGGGASCSLALLSSAATAGPVISNIVFSGTWNTASTIYAFLVSGSTLAGLHFEATCNISVGANTSMTGVSSDSAATPLIDIDSSAVSNIHLLQGTVRFDGDEAPLDNFTLKTISFATGAVGNRISNGKVIDLVDLSFGNEHHTTFSNVAADAGWTVADGADFVAFEAGSRAGVIAGGGGATITFEGANSDGCSVIGCYTDAAIANSGTDTKLTSNTVY